MHSFGRLLVLLGALGSLWAQADDAQPAAGAEARVLSCGYSSRVSLSTFRWEVTDGVVTIRHRTASLDTGAKVPKVRGKPPIGCPFGLPGPGADWQLKDAARWMRTADGWVDAKGRPVTVQCSEQTVKAVKDATALVANPRSDGCAGERQLILKGGERVETKVVRCVVAGPKNERPMALTFGVELVVSDNDCGGGSDYRVD